MTYESKNIKSKPASTSAVSVVKINSGADNVKNGPAIAAAQKQATNQAVPYMLKKADFEAAKKDGATVINGQADGVLFIGQAGKYGSSPAEESEYGYNERVLLGVGFLIDKNKEDSTPINLVKDNVRMTAGIRIDQRTDSGKKDIEEYDDSLDRDRDLTTNAPLNLLSSVQIVGDRVAIGARTAGVDIIGGFDPTIPTTEGAAGVEPRNTGYYGGGVKLISSNWDAKILNDETHPFGLQPIPKGYNLERSLTDIIGLIEQLNKVVKKMHVANTIAHKATRAAVASHYHAGTAYVPVAPGGVVPAYVQTVPDPVLAGTLTSVQVMKSGKDVLTVLRVLTQRYNAAAARLNKSIISEGYINSRGNWTT